VCEQGCVGVHHPLGRRRRARRVHDRQWVSSVDVALHRFHQAFVDRGGGFSVDQHVAQLRDDRVVLQASVTKVVVLKGFREPLHVVV
jgi:hypothetical protein